MWSVASCASLGLKRGVLENKWPLLVVMAFDAGNITTNGQLGLFRFKSAMSVVTVTALHRSFEDLMMKRFGKLRFRLGMAAHTKLRFALLKHSNVSVAGVLSAGAGDIDR